MALSGLAMEDRMATVYYRDLKRGWCKETYIHYGVAKGLARFLRSHNVMTLILIKGGKR